MLDHITLKVGDVAAAKAFFDAALRPLGISALVAVTAEQSGTGAFVGYGENDRCFFWIGDGETSGPMHVAFVAPDHRTVDAFHAAAISAGGRDNGAPGLRPHYGPDYYGAFVLGPGDHNVEAVCRTPA